MSDYYPRETRKGSLTIVVPTMAVGDLAEFACRDNITKGEVIKAALDLYRAHRHEAWFGKAPTVTELRAIESHQHLDDEALK